MSQLCFCTCHHYKLACFLLQSLKYYSVCMCAYEVKVLHFYLHTLHARFNWSHSFAPSSPIAVPELRHLSFSCQLLFSCQFGCMCNFHIAVLQCRRTFCRGLPNVAIIALLLASEGMAPAATSLLVPTPMLNPVMTWRMSLLLCLSSLCSLHTPWAASLGKGGLLCTHINHTDQSLSLFCSQISTIQTQFDRIK